MRVRTMVRLIGRVKRREELHAMGYGRQTSIFMKLPNIGWHMTAVYCCPVILPPLLLQVTFRNLTDRRRKVPTGNIYSKITFYLLPPTAQCVRLKFLPWKQTGCKLLYTVEAEWDILSNRVQQMYLSKTAAFDHQFPVNGFFVVVKLTLKWSPCWPWPPGLKSIVDFMRLRLRFLRVFKLGGKWIQFMSWIAWTRLTSQVWSLRTLMREQELAPYMMNRDQDVDRKKRTPKEFLDLRSSKVTQNSHLAIMKCNPMNIRLFFCTSHCPSTPCQTQGKLIC